MVLIISPAVDLINSQLSFSLPRIPYLLPKQTEIIKQRGGGVGHSICKACFFIMSVYV